MTLDAAVWHPSAPRVAAASIYVRCDSRGRILPIRATPKLLLTRLLARRNEFVEMMELLDKRLNDKGKNWRHVFKALTLLDYLLHAGSENVVIYFRDNIYVVKTLKEFMYVDEMGKDQGANGECTCQGWGEGREERGGVRRGAGDKIAKVCWIREGAELRKSARASAPPCTFLAFLAPALRAWAGQRVYG